MSPDASPRPVPPQGDVRPSLLHERFPALSESLPRLVLGSAPTPVRELCGLDPGGSPIWVKDDSAYGTGVGGNKPRKLEWTLADALHRGRRTVVTVGGLATNHGLATATYARRAGLRPVLLLVDQPLDGYVRDQLARLERSGAAIYRTRGTLRTVVALPWVVARHLDLRRLRLPYLLPAGGSSPLGCVGYVEAALELAAQVDAGELPEPSHIVVALGSGGTAAGLAAGLQVAGLRTRVVAILVSDILRLNERTVARLARRTIRLLRRRGAELEGPVVSASNLDVETRWLGAGYGHRTAAAERAHELLAARDGLELDPVYTAKAMAGLLGLRDEGRFGSGPVLYWHTRDALAPAPGPSG